MKRRILKSLFLLTGAVFLWIFLPPLFYQPKRNLNPLPSHFLKGVYHIHTTFSDGELPVDKIMEQAAGESLDFVIISDHGRPNRAAMSATRWLNDMLVIGASELSLNEGHMFAGDFRPSAADLPPEAQSALDVLAEQESVTFISHPFDSRIPWTDWNVSGFSGIEILNAYQSAKSASILKALSLPGRYLLNPDYAVTSLFRYPEKEFETWDRFSLQAPTWGIYALDAHGRLPLNKKSRLPFPSYRTLFRILRVYAEIDEDLKADAGESAALVFRSLKRGRFFSAIESIAPANGFRAMYQENTDKTHPMGSIVDHAGGKLIFETPFDFSYRLEVLRNGRTVFNKEASGRKRITMDIGKEGGVFRAVLFKLGGPFARLPWIIANPFYIQYRFPEKKESPAGECGVDPARMPLFQLEKNKATSASVEMNEANILKLTFTLQRESPGNPEFWAALALRQNPSFPEAEGICFDARSSRDLLCWLQIRTGADINENEFRHSFSASGDWKHVFIPFSIMRKIKGKTDGISGKKITSLFLVLDGEIAHPGDSGALEIRNFGIIKRDFRR